MLNQLRWGFILGASLFILFFWVLAYGFGTSIFLALLIGYLILGKHFVDELKEDSSKNFCHLNRVIAGLVMMLSGYAIISRWFHWYAPPSLDIFSGLTLTVALIIIALSYVGDRRIDKRGCADIFSGE